MKILHIIPSVAAIRGGPSQAVLELVKALRDYNVDAEIATTNDNGPEVFNMPLSQRIEYNKVPVWFFPRFSPRVSGLREYAFSGLFTRWLWRHIAEYDLLHIHALFSYTCSMAMFIARLKKVPYIVRPNGMLCKWSLKQGVLKKQIYLALIERHNINQARALEFTSSPEQEKTATLNFRPPSFILPYGLSVPERMTDAASGLRQFLKVPEKEPIILFMSRLHYKKGLEYLILALGQIKDRAFRFVIAGSGSKEYESKISKLLKTAGIYNRTYALGYVQGERKQLLLEGSDIFVLTSYSESFGLAVLEALASGLPVVVSRGVPLASLIEQHQLGFVVDMNTGVIASTLKSCLNNLQGLKEMGERGREVILKEYNWNCIAGKLVKVYTAIIKREAFLKGNYRDE